MAFTARLKPELEAEARLLAGQMGISLMALVSVALSEFVSVRRTRPFVQQLPVSAGSPSPPSSPPGGEVLPAPLAKGDRSRKGPKPPPPSKVKHTSGAAAFHRPYGPHGAAIVRQPMAFKPPKSRSDPCPCGARDRLTDHPVKFKHCHGRDSGSASGAGGSV